jgi:DNA-binding Lrp family transcriptional regulator
MKCRSCNSDSLELILDLGEQPWCNDFLSENRVGKEKLYPLRLNHCTDCGLLQLDHTVPKETMFGDHCYLSGMTQTLKNHFYEVADENVKQFQIQPNDLVVDIGGNDGTQLQQYQECGIENVLNVECAERVSEISRENGVKTITEYFNKKCVHDHIGENSVKLFNASGVFFHLEELHSVIDGIKLALRDDGVLIVQFMYAGTMVEKLNFDTIYHEHLCYYTMRSLNNLVGQYGLEIFDAYYSEIHSGSIIAKITHKGGKLDKKTSRYQELLEKDKKYTLKSFKEFADKVQRERSSLKNLLEKLKNDGKTIYAYGAPAKGNTLLNYFGIDKTLVDKAVEINDLKIGNYLPQSHIPIERETKEDRPDYYLLLSHNFADEIIKKNEELIESGTRFIVPFPQIKIVEKNV